MKIVSLVSSKDDKKKVELLAEELDLTITYDEPHKNQCELMLGYDEDGLALIEKGLILRGDFLQMLPRIRTSNLRGELLVRAAKIKGADRTLTAIDATAGLGEDAILLAASGFYVDLYEYNPIIAALLQDSLNRAKEIPELCEIVKRMKLHKENSVDALSNLEKSPDVILLDPMFPTRQKSSLVKKKFQLLQHLEQPCTNAEELMQAAIKAHPHKIVIKRPSKGEYLANIKPNYSIEGKGIRYDCITIN